MFLNPQPGQCRSRRFMIRCQKHYRINEQTLIRRAAVLNYTPHSSYYIRRIMGSTYYYGVPTYIQGDFCKSTPPNGRHTILIYFGILYETRNLVFRKKK